jgi:hypothetical protein
MTERGRIAVLGLYRSGSTAIAGALHRLGVAMGEPFWCDYYEPQWLSQELRRWWNEPYVRGCVPRPQRVFVLAEWIEALERTGVPWVGAKHPLVSIHGRSRIPTTTIRRAPSLRPTCTRWLVEQASPLGTTRQGFSLSHQERGLPPDAAATDFPVRLNLAPVASLTLHTMN